MAQDLAWVVKMTSRLPAELQKAQLRGVRGGALHVTRGIRQEIKIASGGDNKLSGVGRKGARVGAKYEIKGTTNPTAIISAKGPLHFIEHPTRSHAIKPRRKKAMKFKNGLFKASADHPGTKPSKPFEKGYLKTREETGKIFDLEIQKAIRRVLS